jgi:hypothetical protein
MGTLSGSTKELSHRPLSYKGGGLAQSWEHLWRPRITVRVGEPIHEAVAPEELRRIAMDLGGASC